MKCWEKEGGVGEKLFKTLPVGHDIVVKYKIMETG